MIYVVQLGPNGPVKIGYGKKPYTRIAGLRVSWPYEPIVLAVFPGDREKEREIHHRLRKYHMRGEWFLPAKEVLDLSAECDDWRTGYAKESGSMPHHKRSERRAEMFERVFGGEDVQEVARTSGITVATLRLYLLHERRRRIAEAILAGNRPCDIAKGYGVSTKFVEKIRKIARRLSSCPATT